MPDKGNQSNAHGGLYEVTSRSSGTQAENDNRAMSGDAPAYCEKAFLDLINKHNLTGY
jgi:hypothetical protein